MTGKGDIFQVAITGGPVAYAWKDDINRIDLHTAATGKTKAQAYSDVAGLAQAMSGTITSVVLIFKTDQGGGRGTIFQCTSNGPYGYIWSGSLSGANQDTIVTGKTLAQAFSDLGTLANNLPGTLLSGTIQPTAV